ncbi:hypothetical protein [Brevibacillus laterosporus]|uniref:hypothetical protein n=1 Tax=Brevibacillus laterosporus TaxID=1465 RepID=UPI001C3EEBD8|nr:hypothetical protein [Brevibacillus laterosporus]
MLSTSKLKKYENQQCGGLGWLYLHHYTIKFNNWKPYQLWLQTAFGQESPLLFVHTLAYTMVLNPFPNRTVLVSL